MRMSASRCSSLNVDAVVIGSGPAGSLAAYALARQGVRTLLVDRAAHPRAKVCGCCIAPQGQHALHREGLGDALRDARPLARLQLHWRGRRVAVRKSGYVALGREALDARLAAAAERAGATTLWNTRACVMDDGAVHVQGSGHQHVVRGAVVVCADGLHGSSLTSHGAFAWRIAAQSRMGIGATLQADACDLPHDEVRMVMQIGGYVGLVRLPDGRIDVAAAVLPSVLRAAGGPDAWLRAPLLEAGCTRAGVQHVQWRGTAQLTRRRTPIAHDRVLVTGDAAAYVEPITGEGISWAIATGVAAGQLAARMVAGQAQSSAWPLLHAQVTRRSRWRCSAVAGMMRVPALVSGALAVARSAPGTAAALLRPIGAETSA
jgi:flavin-dependent dehydrogenase